MRPDTDTQQGAGRKAGTVPAAEAGLEAGSGSGARLSAPHRRTSVGPRLREKVVVAGYRAGQWLIGRLPLEPTVRVGGWATEVVYRLRPSWRTSVLANVSHVLGLPPGDRRVGRLARSIYRNQVRWVVEGLHLANTSRQERIARFEAARFDEFDAVRASAHGLILAGLHIGNAEAVALALADRGWPMHVVADDTAYQELFDEFTELRRQLGIVVIPWRNLREVFRVLRREEIVGLLVDWGYRPEDQPVRLLGSWTTLPAGPAVLAGRTGATIVPFWTIRRPDGSFTGDMGDPIRVPSIAPAEIARATQAIADALGVGIRSAPEQWCVFKRMWPDDPAVEAELAERAAAALAGGPGAAATPGAEASG